MGVQRGVLEVKEVRGHSWGPTVVRVGVPREGGAKGHERVSGVRVGVPRGVPEVKGVRGHSWGPTVVRMGVLGRY